MTKKQLNWRLKDLPDAVDVAELVDKKVITPAEARQLLFNEDKTASSKVKELEEEVKFLRELCDKLAAKSNGWTTIIKEYRDYTPRYPVWYNSYSTAIGSGTTYLSAGNTAGGVIDNTTGSLTTAPKQLLSSIN